MRKLAFMLLGLLFVLGGCASMVLGGSETTCGAGGGGGTGPITVDPPVCTPPAREEQDWCRSVETFSQAVSACGPKHAELTSCWSLADTDDQCCCKTGTCACELEVPKPDAVPGAQPCCDRPTYDFCTKRDEEQQHPENPKLAMWCCPPGEVCAAPDPDCAPAIGYVPHTWSPTDPDMAKTFCCETWVRSNL